MENQEHPKVGVGVMIFKDNKIFLARRKGSHGAGEWAFPGGHLEYMETIEECARRETREEAGIEIENVKFQFLANVKVYGNKHYVHIGFTADYKAGELRNMEPEKSEAWEWFPLDSLPSPMFKMCSLAVEAYQTGKNFFDS